MRKSITLLLAALITCSMAWGKDGEKRPAKVYFKDGKLHFSSIDEQFHLWMDNRIYLDAAIYSPVRDVSGLTSKINKDLEEDDGHFRFSNGVSVRRARFALKAEFYRNWFAELDLDFANNEVEIKDLFVGYRFNKRLSLKAGHFKVPMSMERTTSSKYLSLAERPMAVEAFADGRRLGIAATAWGNGWWVSGGAFGREIDIIQKERNRGDDGWALAARVALSTPAEKEWTVHVGGYANYQTPAEGGLDDRMAVFRTFPESRVDRRRFVQTEIENVRHYAVAGVEAGFRFRKWLAYGEYIYTNLSRYTYGSEKQKTDLENAIFNGWYVTASYMILGENRRYAPDEAEFSELGQSAKGHRLEIAGRVSHINLNDFHDPKAYITGGKATSYSAALNWMPVRNVMLGLNYIYMDNDKYADSKGQITVGNQPLSAARPEGIDFHILQLRLMVSF